MKDLSWDRSEAIDRLRRDVWRYVTQASKTEEELLLWAAALLQMPPAEVRYLAQLQFILSEPVGRLLEQMPLLIRRLTTTTRTEVEISAERIRGAIRWSETFAQRAATGLPHVFVTAPSRRAFQTPENEILAFALFAIAEFGRRTGWDRSSASGPAQIVAARVAEATKWRQARALIDVPAKLPTPTTIARVRASRNRVRYQAALDVVELYQRYIGRLDRSAIRDAVEHHALIASRDSVLLELECAFGTIRALRESRLESISNRAASPAPHLPGTQGRFSPRRLLPAGTRRALGGLVLRRDTERPQLPDRERSHPRPGSTSAGREHH